jgi:hypothetical protein
MSRCDADLAQYFITPISAVNFRDEELEFPMGRDGKGGNYGTLLKKVTVKQLVKISLQN